MGRRSTPNFVDLDGDDDLDLAVGTDDGTLFSLEDLTLRQAIIISFDEDTINAAPQLLGADVAFLNGPTSSFDGSNLTVRGAPAEDTVSALSIGAGADQIGVAGAVVSFGGVTIAALVGGDAGADLTFNTAAIAAALIQSLTYVNSSDAPTQSRDLATKITDASGEDLIRLTRTATTVAGINVGTSGASSLVDLDGDDNLGLVVGGSDGKLRSYENTPVRGQMISVTVTPQNNAPIAQGNALATDEDTAISCSGLADNDAGADADADGDALSVVAVNGGAEASGALLTLGPDGSDDHDPNGAFDVLAEGENGANSFTYTVSGGALQSSARGADTALFAIAQVDPSVAITAVPALRAIGEVAQLTAGTSRQTLTLANDDIDPAVFALVPSLIEANAPATRFHNVSGPGAEIMLQEPKRANDPATGLQIPNITDHAAATFTLLVLEKGMHTLEDGMIIQVGEISTNKFSSMILRMSPSPTISPPRRRSFVRFRPMPGSISPSRADAPRMQTASS
ncbi:MAG: hypothetical protein ACI87T_001693 [Planctomycetota bacterium]|jgi:hypothetical protein